MHKLTDNKHTARLWLIQMPVQDELLDYYRTVLIESENTQANEISALNRRQQWIVCRAILRLLLAKTLQTETDSVEITLSQYGKPQLLNATPRLCEFNLSHSEKYAVIALCNTSALGIDIQHQRTNLDPLRFADRFFNSMELIWLQNQPPNQQRESFYQLWTRKEALIKAIGEGISFDNLKTDMTRSDGLPTQTQVTLNKQLYCVQQVPKAATPAGYSCAIAVQAAEFLLETHLWNHPDPHSDC